MNEQILLTSISTDELRNIISESIGTELQKFKQQEFATNEEPLLKIKDIAKLLNVSGVTVFAWKKQGRIPFHRISNKIYFKKSEVLESLKKIERRG